jgi:hypothetical protein
LRDERLIEPYYDAMSRYPSRCWVHKPLINELVRSLPLSRIVTLYKRFDRKDVRRDIVHVLYEAPGPATIEFLMARLEEPEHQFSAIQALGILGAVVAGPAIHRLLKQGHKRVREMAADVLGKFRYRPAIGDLQEVLRIVAQDEGSKENGGVAYFAVGSLGEIGGAEAYRALGEFFHATTVKGAVLRALVSQRESEGLVIARQLAAEHPEARTLLADAIGYPDFNSRPLDLDDLGSTKLQDEVLLDYVIQSAQEALQSKKIKFTDHSLRAVAIFALPRARKFLEDIAAGEPTGKQHSYHRGSMDPVIEARRWLAQQGDPRYQREMIESEIAEIQQARAVGDWHVQRLARWPKGVVRDVLLTYIRQGHTSARCLFLLQCFKDPEDEALFKEYEQDADIAIADAAHRYLKKYSNK